MKKRFAAITAAAVLAVLISLSLSAPAYAEDADGAASLSQQWVTDQANLDILLSGLTLETTNHIAYMVGSDNYFNPEAYLTRAEAATIILRLLSRPVDVTASFSDVSGDAWYAQAVNTIGTLGIVTTDAFYPDRLISRSEFARYLGSFFPPRTDAQPFSDVPANHKDAAYLLTGRAWGWLNGFSDGSFHPDDPLTRAEAATMVNRALGRSPDKDYLANKQPVFYWDVAPNNWYYYEVMEASVAHEHTGDAETEQWTYCKTVPAGLKDGFQYVSGWLCYFDSAKNDFVRNASIGTFDFNAQGHFTTGNEELDALLHTIYKENVTEAMTQEEKLRILYVYTRDSFTYLRRDPYAFGVLDFMEEDALRMLTTGYGNCYCYASVFWYLARWTGYDARIVNGTVGVRKSPHCWVEITFNGKSYIFDTELEMAYRLKNQYINMYKWLGEGWNYVR